MDLVKIEIAANNNTYSTEIFIPESLAEAVKRFGEETVFGFIKRGIEQRGKVKLGSIVRDTNATQESIEKAFAAWSPFETRTRKGETRLTKGFVDKLHRLTPEQKRRLLRELQTTDTDTASAATPEPSIA